MNIIGALVTLTNRIEQLTNHYKDAEKIGNINFDNGAIEPVVRQRRASATEVGPKKDATEEVAKKIFATGKKKLEQAIKQQGLSEAVATQLKGKLAGLVEGYSKTYFSNVRAVPGREKLLSGAIAALNEGGVKVSLQEVQMRTAVPKKEKISPLSSEGPVKTPDPIKFFIKSNKDLIARVAKLEKGEREIKADIDLKKQIDGFLLQYDKLVEDYLNGRVDEQGKSLDEKMKADLKGKIDLYNKDNIGPLVVVQKKLEQLMSKDVDPKIRQQMAAVHTEIEEATGKLKAKNLKDPIETLIQLQTKCENIVDLIDTLPEGDKAKLNKEYSETVFKSLTAFRESLPAGDVKAAIDTHLDVFLDKFQAFQTDLQKIHDKKAPYNPELLRKTWNETIIKTHHEIVILAENLSENDRKDMDFSLNKIDAFMDDVYLSLRRLDNYAVWRAALTTTVSTIEYLQKNKQEDLRDGSFDITNIGFDLLNRIALCKTFLNLEMEKRDKRNPSTLFADLQKDIENAEKLVFDAFPKFKRHNVKPIGYKKIDKEEESPKAPGPGKKGKAPPEEPIFPVSEEAILDDLIRRLDNSEKFLHKLSPKAKELQIPTLNLSSPRHSQRNQPVSNAAPQRAREFPPGIEGRLMELSFDMTVVGAIPVQRMTKDSSRSDILPEILDKGLDVIIEFQQRSDRIKDQIDKLKEGPAKDKLKEKYIKETEKMFAPLRVFFETQIRIGLVSIKKELDRILQMLNDIPEKIKDSDGKIVGDKYISKDGKEINLTKQWKDCTKMYRVFKYLEKNLTDEEREQYAKVFAELDENMAKTYSMLQGLTKK